MREARLEDYIVKKLIDFDDIDYFTQSDLLYDLAGQAVAHYKAQRYDSQEVVAKASASSNATDWIRCEAVLRLGMPNSG